MDVRVGWPAWRALVRRSFAGVGAVQGHPVHRWTRGVGILALAAFALVVVADSRWGSLHHGVVRALVLNALAVTMVATYALAILVLTSRQSDVSAMTVLTGVVVAAGTTIAWFVVSVSPAGLPERGDTAVVAVIASAVLAGVWSALRARDAAAGVIGALWTSVLGFFLLFVGPLLTFALVSASVPNTQGRVMLPTATAAERLAENRIEAPEGYLVLFLLGWIVAVLLCCVLPLLGPATRPAATATVPVSDSQPRGT